MRWRLICAFMAITLLVVLVQDIPLGSYLVRVERDRLATSLERDAFLLSGRAHHLLEAGASRDAAAAPVTVAVRDYGRASGARTHWDSTWCTTPFPCSAARASRARCG